MELSEFQKLIERKQAQHKENALRLSQGLAKEAIDFLDAIVGQEILNALKVEMVQLKPGKQGSPRRFRLTYQDVQYMIDSVSSASFVLIAMDRNGIEHGECVASLEDLIDAFAKLSMTADRIPDDKENSEVIPIEEVRRWERLTPGQINELC